MGTNQEPNDAGGVWWSPVEPPTSPPGRPRPTGPVADESPPFAAAGQPWPDRPGIDGPPTTPSAMPSAMPSAPDRTRARVVLSLVVVLATAGSIAAWSLSSSGLGDTGLFFILTPAILALALANIQPTSSAGQGFAGITLALLITSIFLREGAICVLLASPLVYLVMVLAWAVSRPRGGGRPYRSVGAAAVLSLALGSEGVAFELPSASTATAVVVVDASAEEVRTSVASTPDYSVERSRLLRLPFPRPTSAQGQGVAVGDRRTITFDHGEAGSMALVVVESTDRSVTFAVEADTTPMAAWVTIEEVSLAWSDVNGPDGGQQVEVAMAYVRRLDPGWYFGPLQRWGMGDAADYLGRALTASAAAPGPAPDVGVPVGAPVPTADAGVDGGGEGRP